MKRRRNVEDWQEEFLDMVRESEGLSEDLEVSPELARRWSDYAYDLRQALGDWVASQGLPPSRIAELMEADAEYNVYQTLSGAGVGIWDGRWDHLLTKGQIEDLSRYLKRRLGHHVDDTGGGRIPDEMHDIAWRAQQQGATLTRRNKRAAPKRSSRSRKKGKKRSARSSARTKKPKRGFVDARALHRRSPATFEIPSPQQLEALRPGDFVKAAAKVGGRGEPGAERLWFEVLETKGSKIRARLDNKPGWTDVHGLELGDKVQLDRKNVYSTMKRNARSSRSRNARANRYPFEIAYTELATAVGTDFFDDMTGTVTSEEHSGKLRDVHVGYDGDVLLVVGYLESDEEPDNVDDEAAAIFADQVYRTHPQIYRGAERHVTDDFEQPDAEWHPKEPPKALMQALRQNPRRNPGRKRPRMQGLKRRRNKSTVVSIGPRGEVCAMPGALSSKERYALPNWAFALPGSGARSGRKYPLYALDRQGRPVPSKTHAINAKARAKQQLDKGNLTRAQYNRVVRMADEVIAKCKSAPTRKGQRRAAAANPSDLLEVSRSEISKKLGPLLDTSQEWLLDQLVLIGKMDGDAYRADDAAAAVDRAFDEIARSQARSLREDFNNPLRNEAIRLLKKRWKETRKNPTGSKISQAGARLRQGGPGASSAGRLLGEVSQDPDYRALKRKLMGGGNY